MSVMGPLQNTPATMTRWGSGGMDDARVMPCITVAVPVRSGLRGRGRGDAAGTDK
jgi:hypothetical protein